MDAVAELADAALVGTPKPERAGIGGSNPSRVSFHSVSQWPSRSRRWLAASKASRNGGLSHAQISNGREIAKLRCASDAVLPERLRIGAIFCFQSP